MNHTIIFFDQNIKTNLVPALFSYFLELLYEKKNLLKKCDDCDH